MLLRRILVLLGLLFVLSILHLMLQTQIINIDHDLMISKIKYSTVQNEFRTLNAKASQLKSLPRIESISKNNLGMITPSKINYLVLEAQ
ncbi:MAG: hypothetical protein V1843_00985 [bacterium]